MDFSRSITPFCSSCASTMAVPNVANAALCAMMPGIRKLTYPPGTLTGIAPPKTNRNSSTNITGWITVNIR